MNFKTILLNRYQHLLIAVLIFAAEILIATTFAHVPFIRASMGDFLVVILLYHLVKVFRNVSPLPLSIGIFIFACLVETTQYFHLSDTLGLQRGSLLSILLGTHFSWMDILMYGLGCVNAYLFDTYWFSPRNPRAI